MPSTRLATSWVRSLLVRSLISEVCYASSRPAVPLLFPSLAQGFQAGYLLTDRTEGRRVGMALGAIFIIIGTIVQATCHNLGGFMAGRFILGFGVATSATAGPAYVSEIAHPAYRGAMTGLYNVLWFGGGIPGTFIPWRTSSIEGNMSWRIPIWLQMVFSGLVLCFCFTVPEV